MFFAVLKVILAENRAERISDLSDRTLFVTMSKQVKSFIKQSKNDKYFLVPAFQMWELFFCFLS